jgi:hypothetical protein
VKTAVDSSVLIDVLLGDTRFGPASREALRAAYGAGALVACDVVWAEVRACFPADEPFAEAMELIGVGFDAVEPEAAALAGELWRPARAHAVLGHAARRATDSWRISSIGGTCPAPGRSAPDPGRQVLSQPLRPPGRPRALTSTTAAHGAPPDVTLD